MDYAHSTLAMTAYNLICVFGQAMGHSQLLNAAIRCEQFKTVEADDFDTAVKMAVERELLTFKGGLYDVPDPKRRKVINRDQSDGRVENGVPKGGWNRWTVSCKDRGFILLTSALEEPVA